MGTKACRECGDVKSLDSFHTHAQMRDGHLNYCKLCVCLRVRIHRRESTHVQAYDRMRGKLPERIADMTRRTIISRAENKEMWRARSRVAYAVKTGKMHAQPCEVCGDEKVEAHHYAGYDKPLEVQWLCPLHHRRLEFSKLGV